MPVSLTGRWSRRLPLLLLVGCIEQPAIESLPDIDFTSVATGRDHACGLAATGEVYCWSRVDPRPVIVSDGVPFRTVATSWDHTCGIAVDGAAYCWGMSTTGQLGAALEDLGSCIQSRLGRAVPCSPTPIAVAGDLVFASISTGAAHTCGLTPDGQAWCWGANGVGQLGTIEATPCDSTLAPDGLCSTTPVRVDGGHRFVSLSAGRIHTCAVDDNADGWCWGFGGEGRLGTGTGSTETVPAPVTGNLEFQHVSAGGSHSCGVTPQGRGYCWGSNSDGQLGSLENDLDCGVQQFRCLYAPHPVQGDIEFVVISASDAVAIGGLGPLLGGHSCGLTRDGSVYCWGLNTSGQLFSHGGLRSSSPVHLDTDERFAEINTGMENTCGVTTDMRVMCWAYGGPQLRWYVFSGD